MQRFLVTTLVSAAVVSALASHLPAANADTRPNILIIVTDDQRGNLSAMPAVRKYMVREGTRYTDGYVTTPLCCPSRASIFTGRYAHNHGVESNAGPEESQSDPLDQETTIQSYLQGAGYRTAIFGKYLNSWPTTSTPPYFDEWAIGDNRYRGGTLNIDGTLSTVHR
jgi:arylsulfatase A-like enzyme